MPSPTALHNPPLAAPVSAVHRGPATVLAWMLFLLPTVGVPSQLVLQDTLKSAVLALGVLAAALLFFWQQRQRAAPLRWHGLVWLPLVLMVYALGSMVWSHAYLAGVEAIRWLVLSLLLWLGLNTINRTTLPTLLWGVHAGTVGASVWVALQFWFDLGLFPQAAFPASTFINRNFFAEYAVSALPFSVWLLANLRNTRALPAMAASVALVVLAIMMTGTRSALVALLVLAAVFAVVGLRYRHVLPWVRWNRANRWGVVAVLVGGIVGLGAVPSSTPRVLAEGLGTTALKRSYVRTASLAKPTEYTVGSFSVRSIMWKSTARMMIAHPWSGVGAGAWEVQIPLYQPIDSIVETDYYAHNEYLQLLSEYGLLVGGLFLAFLSSYLLVSAGTTWLLGRTQTDEAPLRALTLASMLALLLVSNAGFPWHLACTGALFMVNLAILAGSDDRLGRNDPFFARPLPWRPVFSRITIGVVLCALLLATYLTQRAVQAERKIVGSIVNSMALSHPQPGQPAPPIARTVQLLRDIREGIALNPHYRKLTPMVADELARMGDWGNAVWIWESVVASRPHVAALWRNMAQAYSLLGQHDKAQQALAQLQRLQADMPATRTLEITLLSRAGQTDQLEHQLNRYYEDGLFTYDMVQTGYTVGYQSHRWALAIRSLELRNTTWPALAADGYFRLGMVYANPDPTVHDDAKALASFKAGLAAVPPEQEDNFRKQVPEPYRAQL